MLHWDVMGANLHVNAASEKTTTTNKCFRKVAHLIFLNNKVKVKARDFFANQIDSIEVRLALVLQLAAVKCMKS